MKDLKFIHITKTAGTSIEDTGHEIGVMWGRFHKEYGWWHECFPRKPEKIRKKYDWFTVVRNPYDRIISEFHCVFARSIHAEITKDAIDKKDAEMFNRIIRHKIKARSPKGDHYTEQCEYLKDMDVRIIRFENIKNEFDELMRERKINLTLNIRENAGKKTFSLRDLDQGTVDLINKVYKKDFHMLGYRMASSPSGIFL